MSLEDIAKSWRSIVGVTVVGVAVIFLTAMISGSYAVSGLDKALDARIDARIDATVDPVLASINSKLGYLVQAQSTGFVLSVEKQAEKIKKDPADIKMSDIVYVLQGWKSFPDELKTDDLAAKYEVIKNWYTKNQ